MNDEYNFIIRKAPPYKEVKYGDIQVLGKARRCDKGRMEYFNVPETTHAEMGIMLVMKDREAYEQAFAHRRQKKNYLIPLIKVIKWLKRH